MTEIDKMFIAAFFFGCTTFITIVILAIYWALKLYLDDLWKQGEKTKRRVKRLGKSRRRYKNCRILKGDK